MISPRSLVIKLNYLKQYYIFEKFGIPKIKYDKISKTILKKYLPRKPTIIDCGAHVGSDSVELVRILGGQVFAFEPVPDIFERLKRNTRKYPGIRCYNLALSDKSGKQSFFVSEGASDASSSLLEPMAHLEDHPDTVFNNKIEVQTKSLDDWAREEGIGKIDLLWLDMQGFELQMLRASTSILDSVSVIHTEVSTKETYKGVTTYNEFKSFLEGKGFRVVLEAIPENWDMGNVLFVKNELAG